jgi:hypothetical protein
MNTAESESVHPKDRALFALIDRILDEYEQTRGEVAA